jgi:hydrogenase large subunit
MATKTIQVPLNRVEGDLEIKVALKDGQVADAWSSGLMFRGFERIMIGRAPLDGLVITPRICGICTTAHLTTASRALDMIAGAMVPPDAVRMRNLALMTEVIQSDLRHTFLMYAVDFANPAYRGAPWFEEAVRRFQPFKGETALEVIRETKKILGIVAIIGGQWPHSSYMVPGGIASVPSGGDLLQCRLLLRHYRLFYERRILGCSIERWAEVQSAADLDAWLEESPEHRRSDLGFFIHMAREAGLDQLGKSHGNFLSYGAYDLPEDTMTPSPDGGPMLQPAGFAQGTQVIPFDQSQIAEHVAHSWFEDYPGGRHPFDGLTRPYASGQEGRKYSWAKAPRYDHQPAETGPLAQMVVAQAPLFVDLVTTAGPSAFVRQLARLVRPAYLFQPMDKWLEETTAEGHFYESPGEIVEGEGYGVSDVTRGALGHWVRIQEGRIQHYQIITPTGWNASPRDTAGVRGPIEEALVGTPVPDPDNPVALGHVVRSFDACLVCTVHARSADGREPGRPLVILP